MTKRKPRPSGRPRTPSKITLKGDHGTGTVAAMAGTVLVPIKDSPNQMGYRQRKDALTQLIDRGGLDMRQAQAAEAIRAAYFGTEALSSGGPIVERVQSSPKPDATIAVQVEAISRLSRAMGAVLRSERTIVEHMCWHGRPFRTVPGGEERRAAARLRAAMTRTADHLDRIGYWGRRWEGG